MAEYYGGITFFTYSISFTFDEDGSSASVDDNNGGSGGDTQDFPSEGDTYQGCYVLWQNIINSIELWQHRHRKE